MFPGSSSANINIQCIPTPQLWVGGHPLVDLGTGGTPGPGVITDELTNPITDENGNPLSPG